MQEYTQEKVDRAEHMGIAIPADVKEQIFEYANLIGEEEKVRTCIKELHEKWLPAHWRKSKQEFFAAKNRKYLSK